MTTRLTKEHVPFLVAAMDAKHGIAPHTAPKATHVQTIAADDITGSMSIPDPVLVDVRGTMTAEDYEKCSLIMAVCTNMVQQTISNAAIEEDVSIADALKNMDAWVAGFTTFPFPFFTFTSQQDDVYQKADFSLKTDPDVVEKIVNIENVAGLKDAVIGALKNSGGEIASYSKEERDFNYFGVITGYNDTNISTRVIKFALHMKNTEAKSLCVTYASTELNSSYNTYEFIGDKYMMIKMQQAVQEKLVDKIAEKLLEFIDDFYQQQLVDFNNNIKNIIAKTM